MLIAVVAVLSALAGAAFLPGIGRKLKALVSKETPKVSSYLGTLDKKL